ncbi:MULTISPECIES: SNF2-related protein [unclassified Microbispora]|uniref:SNF2-related protein n=1 Tax=unclassified Microbispora TaxID=2614687 RepID=UPI00143C8D3D|nr:MULTISPECIES: SNF2-related protein [unclassified Microbispora]NJP26801.1 DEAD/DEAH box helicase family protein [Microbispora sp. CL1-1]
MESTEVVEDSDPALLPDTAVNAKAEHERLLTGNPTSTDSFQAVGLQGSYSPDDKPFSSFYVPMLSRAVSYDRAVGYWSAAELQFAAQGTAHFLANGGHMRLIVGAQLIQKDVDAVLAGEPLDEIVAARLLADPDLAGAKIVEREHLSVLAWMVANGRLEIRVGVPRNAHRLLTYNESGRYFHTKYGIFTDKYGNKVAFNGSNNASVTAWVKNHETLDAYPSWLHDIWNWSGKPKVRDFDKHWNGQADEGWAVIDLPTAVKQHLIHYAPATPFAFSDRPVPLPHLETEPPSTEDLAQAWEDLTNLANAPKRSAYTGVGTAWAQPLPHQAQLIDRVVSTYPRGYLFADEVGLGKTVEAGMVLRELFLSGRAQRALLLVPASVMKQWQEELHEKMNLDVPRYDRGGFVDRFDNPISADATVNPWSAFPIVLASSHLARRRDRRKQILQAGPWDVVLVDEAHHARRRGSKPNDPPNSLLALLQEMRDAEMWRALYLASATPMQMNPHEAWDLISLLGLRGKWGQQAFFFLEYFTRLRTDPKIRGWKLLCEMLADYFSDSQAQRDQRLEDQIIEALGWAGSYAVTALDQNEPSAESRALMPNETSEWMDRWLRRHTPMRDRVFRNTRKTMREYQAAGIIGEDIIIPHRHVEDVFIPLADMERKLYKRIEEYIRRHYNAYKKEKAQQALGFIMTVYRRRLTSSFEAIKKSLRRRLDVLEQGKSLKELLTDDDSIDIEDSLFDPEQFDVSADRLRREIYELQRFLNDLDKITGEDTKATRLVQDVNNALMTYDSVVVFTQYTDTMDYVRERLIFAGIHKIGCYSGRGGEVYRRTENDWTAVSKSEIKNLFRNGDLTVLIGTDSMSEGLNLQTSGRLINYDMPWNLMRVEQRIGRVDRIGATYKNIQVTNYFYAGTVEEQVYKGIAEDYGDFTDIVGDAAPVLANVEKAIEQLALGENVTTDTVTAQVEDIKEQVEDLSNRPVQNDDLGASAEVTGYVEQPPDLHGDINLANLEQRLTDNLLTGRLFVPEPGMDKVYRVKLPTARSAYSFATASGVPSIKVYRDLSGDTRSVLVTFDRDAADRSSTEVTLLTYGTTELEALLPANNGMGDR